MLKLFSFLILLINFHLFAMENSEQTHKEEYSKYNFLHRTVYIDGLPYEYLHSEKVGQNIYDTTTFLNARDYKKLNSIHEEINKLVKEWLKQEVLGTLGMTLDDKMSPLKRPEIDQLWAQIHKKTRYAFEILHSPFAAVMNYIIDLYDYYKTQSPSMDQLKIKEKDTNGKLLTLANNGNTIAAEYSIDVIDLEAVKRSFDLLSTDDNLDENFIINIACLTKAISDHAELGNLRAQEFISHSYYKTNNVENLRKLFEKNYNAAENFLAKLYFSSLPQNGSHLVDMALDNQRINKTAQKLVFQLMSSKKELESKKALFKALLQKNPTLETVFKQPPRQILEFFLKIQSTQQAAAEEMVSLIMLDPDDYQTGMTPADQRKAIEEIGKTYNITPFVNRLKLIALQLDTPKEINLAGIALGYDEMPPNERYQELSNLCFKQEHLPALDFYAIVLTDDNLRKHFGISFTRAQILHWLLLSAIEVNCNEAQKILKGTDLLQQFLTWRQNETLLAMSQNGVVNENIQLPQVNLGAFTKKLHTGFHLLNLWKPHE